MTLEIGEIKMQKDTNNPINRVIEKIEGASNILVAVSKTPTLDELSAAIGLTIMLDGMGKHATAIYSGTIPEVLEFLEPGKTFEVDTNSLQDFIISLSKDKADHLRYKIDGDLVKVFITPYRTTIDQDDLEFSHGDFNIDLMIALGVPEVEDLDAALFDHGKILHEAEAINISNDTPGKFGEVLWTDPSTSSVSEMVAGLAFQMRDKIKMTKTVATALLTGIIANTSRFLNDKTTPKTMDVASRLMQAGANQQLISSSLNDTDLEGGLEIHDNDATSDSGELDISKEETAPEFDQASAEQQLDQMIAQPASSVIDDLAQASVAQASAAPMPSTVGEVTPAIGEVTPAVGEVTPAVEPAVEPTYEPYQPKDYGQMMEEALAEPLPNPAAQAAPAAPTQPEMDRVPDMEYVPHVATTPVTMPEMGNEFLTTSPAIQAMPTSSPTTQEMPAVPETPVMPTAPESPLPMPPVPGMEIPSMPAPEQMSVQPEQSSVQPEQTASQLEQANDPGAFKIPGM